jgi:hypothetical protein
MLFFIFTSFARIFLADENSIARHREESLCTYGEPLPQFPGNLHNAHLKPTICVVLPTCHAEADGNNVYYTSSKLTMLAPPCTTMLPEQRTW